MDLRDVPSKLFEEFGNNPQQHKRGFWFAETEIEHVYVFLQEANFMLAYCVLSYIEDEVRSLYGLGGAGVPKPTVTIQAIINKTDWAYSRGMYCIEDINLVVRANRSCPSSPLIHKVVNRYSELIFSPAVEPSTYWEVERYPERDYTSYPH